MIIEIDVRENKLINLLENKLKEKTILLEKKQLLLADIILKHKDQTIMIERKTINDLAASIGDGRYNEQSFRLDKCNIHNHNIIYLIEGDIRNFKNTNRITQKALYSSLLSLNIFKGFSVLRTFDLEETANEIIFFCEKMIKNEKNNFYYKETNNNVPLNNIIQDNNKCNNEESNNEETNNEQLNTNTYVDVMKQSKKSNITKENIGEIILCQIPSVSKSISKLILSRYKTIKNLIDEYEKDNTIFDDLKMADAKGKERKVNKTALTNIVTYLIENK